MEADTKMDSSYLGWNPVEVRIGSSLYDPSGAAPIDFGFRLGGVRNCSYAPGRLLVGITAEDRSDGGQVVAVFNRANAMTRILTRRDYLLHHALNRAGTQVSFTQPSAGAATADLYILNVDGEGSEVMLEGVLAQGSVPAWFPDDTRLVYHTPDHRIEIFDRAERRRVDLEAGRDPTVSSCGNWIAFRRKDELFVRSLADGRVEKVWSPNALLRRGMADGLSWSADGAYLSFGVSAGPVGKQTRFYVLDRASGASRQTKTRHLEGLLLIEGLMNHT